MIEWWVIHLQASQDMVLQSHRTKKLMIAPVFAALQKKFGDSVLFLLENQIDPQDYNPIDVTILELDNPVMPTGPIQKWKTVNLPKNSDYGDVYWRNTAAFQVRDNTFIVYKNPKSKAMPVGEVAFGIEIDESNNQKIRFFWDPKTVARVQKILRERAEYLNFMVSG